ncbi:MAG: hypothetical protein KGQ93_10360 [Cyanobacteria bacterium REEB459]|nr:hypothetical protein [Cyanobacteria bacterium REEB459]
MGKKYRSKKSNDGAAFTAIFILIVIGFIYNHINTFIILLVIILTIITTISIILKLIKYWKAKRIKQKQEFLRIQAQEEVRKAKERQELLRIQAREDLYKKLRELGVSTNRQDYVISNEDYKRGNKRESEYRKKYLLSLLNLYDTKCVRCGRMDNGLDLDHFFLSKNSGGNFSLLHRDGYLVNNAIPLCQSCNRSKGDRPYDHFFDKDQILFLFTKNREMNFLLNQLKPQVEAPIPDSGTIPMTLPEDIGRYINGLPDSSAWLRQLIVDAVEKEHNR